LQTVPHAPQFAESVLTFVQPCEHFVCPVEQLAPVVPAEPEPVVPPVPVSLVLGLAQPATRSEAPRIATRAAGKEAWRASMFKLLIGGIREGVA
jgi:hypothetical protein